MKDRADVTDMTRKTYKIWEKGEYDYPGYGNFSPTITAYLHENDGKERPAILVVPGGGYYMVCPWEGEPVAEAFYEKGYQVFVLTYTTNFRYMKLLGNQPMRDLSRAVVFLRKNAAELGINIAEIAICGFSAGGHLCGSLMVHHAEEQFREEGEYKGISNRPDAVILCYPVITTEESYTHKESLLNLLGNQTTPEQQEYMSLEKWVSDNAPPVFLWHTVTDEFVPVENSMMFAKACIEKHVPTELHLFDSGPHGMSLGNDNYLLKNLSALYNMEQLFEALPDLIKNGQSIPGLFEYNGQKISDIEAIKKTYLKNIRETETVHEVNDSIAMWTELVNKWLRRLAE